MRNVLFGITLFALSACSTTGLVSQSDVRKINPGMTRADVVEILGDPGNRTFRGDAEALQYCRTGFAQDEYTTVWLNEGTVIGLTTLNDSMAVGSCNGRFPPVDWGQVPADITVDIR